MRVLLVLMALVLGVLAGGYVAAARTGNLVPARDRLGGCLAMNTDTGKAVGSWPITDDRCAIRDYRMKHPFGG